MSVVNKLAIMLIGGGTLLAGLSIFLTFQKMNAIEEEFARNQQAKMIAEMQKLSESGPPTGAQMRAKFEQAIKEIQAFKPPKFWDFPFGIIGTVLGIGLVGFGIYVQSQMKPPPKKASAKVQKEQDGPSIP